MLRLTVPQHSCPGPDGIPFVMYKNIFPLFPRLWPALLQEIAKNDADIPIDFANSDLFLIPKGTGNLTPDRFRPNI